MRYLAIVLVAACGGPHATTTPSNTADHPEAPYAGLFKAGTTWTYAARFESKGEGGRASEPVTGTFTCTVRSVRPLGEGEIADIECAPPPGEPISDQDEHGQIGGVFVRTPFGLWNPAAAPASLAELDPAKKLDLVKEATASCVTQSGTKKGSYLSYKRCFSPIGLVSGEITFAGDAFLQLTYKLAN